MEENERIEPIRVTTSSDYEFSVVQITDNGKERLNSGLPLKEKDIITPIGAYTRIKNQIGKEIDALSYEALYDDRGEELIKRGCYLSTAEMEIEDENAEIEKGQEEIPTIKKMFPCLKVMIPKYTFEEKGYLYVIVASKEENLEFSKGEYLTENEPIKTNIYYVLQ